MKKMLIWSFATLITTLLVAVMPTEAEARIYTDTVRLHILASSDREEDQTLKYALRDAILEKYGELLESERNAEGAAEKISVVIPEIEEFSKNFVSERGFDYEVSAVIGTEWYDTRDYGEFSLPMGYYKSLRIIIGEGEGKNWWCVMYPPLCTEIATDGAPSEDALDEYTKEERTLISGGRYRIKFKSLEILSRAFRKK